MTDTNNRLFTKAIDFIKDPDYRFLALARHGFYDSLSDEEYIRRKFHTLMGYYPNLDDPQTFNEKLQWLKLHDRRPEYVKMVDKYEVKKYVADIIGEEYIIPTLGVWDRFDDINFSQLPDQFVLKCTHDSGGIVICKDKSKFDIQSAKAKINKSLKRNYYYVGREWPYKDVKPHIIAEPYLTDESGFELKDYKILCFNGIPKLIELHSGRFLDNQMQDFYDCDWKKLSISQSGNKKYQVSSVIAPRPKNLEKMIELSSVLSKDFRHIRVDWYEIKDNLLFGELTFFDGSGFVPFDNFQHDLLLGSWINL